MVLAKLKFNKKDCDYLAMELNEIENLVYNKEVPSVVKEMAKPIHYWMNLNIKNQEVKQKRLEKRLSKNIKRIK